MQEQLPHGAQYKAKPAKTKAAEEEPTAFISTGNRDEQAVCGRGAQWADCQRVGERNGLTFTIEYGHCVCTQRGSRQFTTAWSG